MTVITCLFLTVSQQSCVSVLFLFRHKYKSIHIYLLSFFLLTVAWHLFSIYSWIICKLYSIYLTTVSVLDSICQNDMFLLTLTIKFEWDFLHFDLAAEKKRLSLCTNRLMNHILLWAEKYWSRGGKGMCVTALSCCSCSKWIIQYTFFLVSGYVLYQINRNTTAEEKQKAESGLTFHWALNEWRTERKIQAHSVP